MIRHIPTLLTTLNLLFGFLAILVSDFFWSPIFIIAGLVADVFDGAVARALNAQSDFGKELDSLADMVTFGLAPAFLYIQLAPMYGWLQYLPGCFFVAAGAWRLANFNTLPPSKNFIGLAIPSAGGFLIGLILAVHFESKWLIDLLSTPWIYALPPILMGLLMLSKIEMFSLKGMGEGLKANLFLILTALCLILSLVFTPIHSLWIVVAAYVVFSILKNLVGKG